MKVVRQDREQMSTADLVGDLLRGTSNLLSLEIALAKTELSQKASRVGKNVGFLAAGGLIVYAGFLALLATIIAGLGLLMPVWLSALIVSVIVLAIGGFLVYKGLKTLQQEQVAPQRTLDTLREDQEWLKDQKSSDR